MLQFGGFPNGVIAADVDVSAGFIDSHVLSPFHAVILSVLQRSALRPVQGSNGQLARVSSVGGVESVPSPVSATNRIESVCGG